MMKPRPGPAALVDYHKMNLNDLIYKKMQKEQELYAITSAITWQRKQINSWRKKYKGK